QSDADASERSGTARDGEELDRLPIDVVLGEQPVDGRQQLLIARAFALERDAAEERGIVHERDGEERQRRVGGEREHQAAPMSTSSMPIRSATSRERSSR